MKRKRLFVVVTILAVIWLGFIFYMSSQTAVASGQMSESITKDVVTVGEKVGVVKAGTTSSELALRRYDSIIRSTAHVGMYFVLACIMFFVFWIWGLNKKISVILSFVIGAFISFVDEINQMHLVGRNSGGVIRDGIEDIYRDTFGICIALVIFVIIRVIAETRAKNVKV